MSMGMAGGVPQIIYDPSGYAARHVEEQPRPISSLHANLTGGVLAACVGVLVLVVCWAFGLR